MGGPLQQSNRKDKTSLALLLVGAFLLQVFLLLTTDGYRYDWGCFYAWAVRLAEVGPGNFYAPDYFCDYPPGALLMLLPGGAVIRAMGLWADNSLAALALGVLPALAVCGLGLLLWQLARRTMRPVLALRLTALMLFNPALVYGTAVWKQVDSIYLLALAGCFLLLEQRSYRWAALCYGAALALKPQALLAGPVLAVCFLMEFLREPKRAAGNILLGVPIALVPPVFCGALFWGLNTPENLWKLYFDTVESYPYATINGFNAMGAMGGNWVRQEEKLWLLSWQQWGTAAIMLLTIGLAALAWCGWKKGKFSPLLLAGLYLAGIFTFGHRMHERYLLAGVVFLLFAAARANDRRLGIGAAGMALLCWINETAVLSNCGGEDEWLSSQTSQNIMKLCGFGLVLLWIWTLWQAIRWMQDAGRHPFRVASRPKLPQKCGWTVREGAALLALTAATACVSFAYLGEITAPKTVMDTVGRRPEKVTVQPDGQAAQLWIYPEIQSYYGGNLTLTGVSSGEGEPLLQAAIDQGDCFTWQCFEVPPAERYTLTLENVRVIEIAFVDGEGKLLPVRCDAPTALLDEQMLVPERISQLNSFYFDEIYHARTGYEQLHRLPIYETTHPPLGKDFIMLGIAVFGMCGFGWRFFGTLFGVLLVPAFYLLAREMTGSKRASAFAAAILALDTMRFTQSRMATIDTYVVFFVTLGAFFMARYCHVMLERGVREALLPMALGGIAFGLGCASKWTGIYAGAGLAIVYFWALWERTQKNPATRREDVALALGGGTLFYAAIPLGIYLLSYLPYTWKDPAFGLRDWWDCQTAMYRYHSELMAAHPFQSGWYTWPLDLRPVWYYTNSHLPGGFRASIAGFYGPLLAWGGLAAMLALGAGIVGKGADREEGWTVVFYLSQLLPWALVTRCTFLYHYWASAIFGLLAVALWAGRLLDRRPKSAKYLMAAVLAAALLGFLWYYPVMSGLPVPVERMEKLRLLSSWGF